MGGDEILIGATASAPPNPAMKRTGFARRLSPDTLDGLDLML
jgi:hypothetical protein